MKYYKRKYYRFVFLTVLIILFIFLLLLFIDYRFVSKLQEISHMHCKSIANQIIDQAAESVILEMNLFEDPILSTASNEDGYFINTQIINLFCTRFSEEITNRLLYIPQEKIVVPLGAVTNISLLADKGPEVPFSLLPVGAANVNYISDFNSVGINQINYKIWLEISLEIKIINPLYQENTIMKRKVLLADVVFSGKVPDHYFQMKSSDEYLLTE